MDLCRSLLLLMHQRLRFRDETNSESDTEETSESIKILTENETPTYRCIRWYTMLQTDQKQVGSRLPAVQKVAVGRADMVEKVRDGEDDKKQEEHNHEENDDTKAILKNEFLALLYS